MAEFWRWRPCTPDFGQRRVGRNANGAGIAADPTLTSAWSSVSSAPEGASVSKALGARCLSACPKARVLSPALAPASGVCLRSPVLALGRSLPPARHPLGQCRDRWLVLPAFSNGCFRFYPSASSIADQTIGLTADIASHSPQTSRLASGRNLRHAASQKVRGQMPPHLWNFEAVEFQCLVARSSMPSCPEDKLKVPPNRGFGKCGKVEFSTFAQITCGRRWISHQFVAIRVCTVKEPAGVRFGCA